jgi:hypothetical protein
VVYLLKDIQDGDVSIVVVVDIIFRSLISILECNPNIQFQIQQVRCAVQVFEEKKTHFFGSKTMI